MRRQACRGVLGKNLRELRFSYLSSKRRELALLCAIDLSLQTSDRTSEVFCIRLSLTAKSRFPAGETDLNGDLVRLRHLLRRKAKHLVLLGPCGGQVGEAGDAHAMRKSTVNRRFDEIRREERKREWSSKSNRQPAETNAQTNPR